MQSWLPALEGVVEKLERGALVADVGCGHGASTIIMARAFPNSQFVGFDYHAASFAAAREAAERAGVADRATFEVASAKQVPERGFGLVCCFDCLHCIAPGSLDNGLRYAARLKVCSSHAARASSGLRWPFFSISHSAL